MASDTSACVLCTTRCFSFACVQIESSLKVCAVYSSDSLSFACLQMESNLKVYAVSNNNSCSCACLQMESNLEAYAVWYPPVRSSLLCLSKLYGNVDPSIFNGMAQDAVHAATAAVQVH